MLRPLFLRIELSATLLALAICASSAFAEEKLGNLELADFLLEPQFSYTEPKAGRFEPGHSLLSVRWQRDAQVSGLITFGNDALIARPARYGASDESRLGLVEAFAQADSGYGVFRLGLVPLPFGNEAATKESARRFPRSLLYKQRLVGLRDYGLSYAVRDQGFFSEWTVHNGESGQDLDNESWLTARWGYERGLFKIGASGTTGRTTPKSTNPDGGATNEEAGLSVEENSRIRVGNAFVVWDASPVGLALEGTLGEVRQIENNFKFSAAHADLIYSPTRVIGILGRFDQVDPNTEAHQDRVQEASFGVSYKTRYETSVLYLFATRVYQEISPNPAHQVRLIWRLTPQLGPRL